MEKFAVSVMPIVDMDGWKQFVDEVVSGGRGDAHRDLLRRRGVTAEHVFHQPTPMGDLMVVVWEGVDQDQMGQLLGDMLQNPTTDHERYVRDVVVAKMHGIDLTQPPPPPMEMVSSISV
jgi:hypothetical protein